MNLSQWHLGEPAALVGLLQAILALAITFGLHLSIEQVGAIVAVAAAMGGIIVRQQVAPIPPVVAK